MTDISWSLADCPWGLTKEEFKAMMDLVEHGSVKASSARSPESLAAVYAAIRRARKKMQATSTVHAALLWDRWLRSDQKVEPENQAVLYQIRLPGIE